MRLTSRHVRLQMPAVCSSRAVQISTGFEIKYKHQPRLKSVQRTGLQGLLLHRFVLSKQLNHSLVGMKATLLEPSYSIIFGGIDGAYAEAVGNLHKRHRISVYIFFERPRGGNI